MSYITIKDVVTSSSKQDQRYVVSHACVIEMPYRRHQNLSVGKELPE